jgi:hypothetical protein
MSALPPKADIQASPINFRFVPVADISDMTFAKQKDRYTPLSPKSINPE